MKWFEALIPDFMDKAFDSLMTHYFMAAGLKI